MLCRLPNLPGEEGRLWKWHQISTDFRLAMGIPRPPTAPPLWVPPTEPRACPARELLGWVLVSISAPIQCPSSHLPTIRIKLESRSWPQTYYVYHRLLWGTPLSRTWGGSTHSVLPHWNKRNVVLLRLKECPSTTYTSRYLQVPGAFLPLPLTCIYQRENRTAKNAGLVLKIFSTEWTGIAANLLFRNIIWRQRLGLSLNLCVQFPAKLHWDVRI